MKYLVTLLIVISSLNCLGQTTIYSENCGTPSATTSVATYANWQRNGIQTYSGNSDVRTTVPSTGYTGASGSGNIFITNTVNTNCTISGINTIGYTNVCLQFGILKTTNGSNGSQLAVEYSADGTTWTVMSFTLATGAGSSNVWSYIQPSCGSCGAAGLPATSNLRIRFRMASTMTGLQFRIDDINISGTPTVVLPLTLLHFTATNSDTVNTLNWSTASEEDLTVFIIERSENSTEWEQIGNVESNHTSYFTNEYLFTDIKPYPITYYRLVIYNEDESYTYSSIVGVKLNSNSQNSTLEYINILGERIDSRTQTELQTRIKQYIIRLH